MTHGKAFFRVSILLTLELFLLLDCRTGVRLRTWPLPSKLARQALPNYLLWPFLTMFLVKS
jgi:hypothetical protein